MQKVFNRNWLVAARVSEAAREVLEANGGKIEVIHEDNPRLVLVTLVNGLYHGMHKQDHYFSWELDREKKIGLCYWGEDPIALTIYRWIDGSPNDPDLVPPDDITADSGQDESDHPWSLSDEYLNYRDYPGPY